ncbi:MAG: ABC transporter ATP-binding protein [Lachnospiraceae bacterium]|nr:ABC transporter ATP-binding protein [Lachnospiraceae bacterium]
MSEKNDNLLSVRDLVVEYTSGGEIIHAVNGVSFELEKGKTLGLVGETGAGKTTIAKSILRVLLSPPAKVKSGEILLEGTDLLKVREDEMLKIRGAKISMIFQDPMTALNPTMTIGNQIAEGIRLHNDVSALEAEKMAIDMLQSVRIMEERFHEYPFQFSGGMKQRVVIAMALACKPKLLLADEPTTALDVTIQAQVLDTMRDLRNQLGTSMILITHDLGIVAENCDTVAVIYAGQIVESGSKEDIFDHASHPYTVGLFHSLPMWAMGEKRLHPIDGLPPDPRIEPNGCMFRFRCPRATKACEATVPNAELTSGHFCRCIAPKEEV